MSWPALCTWNYGNNFPKGFGNPPDSAPLPDLDWEMWLGPAPLRPFNANRFGVRPESFSIFRYFWDYAGGMMTDWGVHLLDIVQWGLKMDGYGIEFHGTEGTLFVDRSGFQIFPEKKKVGDKYFDLTESAEMKDLPNSHVNHAANFLDCVKSRQRPTSDVEIGHRSTSTCLLPNVAYRSKERLEWDPKTERLTRGGKQAEQLLAYQYRKPWVLSV